MRSCPSQSADPSARKRNLSNPWSLGIVCYTAYLKHKLIDTDPMGRNSLPHGQFCYLSEFMIAMDGLSHENPFAPARSAPSSAFLLQALPISQAGSGSQSP